MVGCYVVAAAVIDPMKTTLRRVLCTYTAIVMALSSMDAGWMKGSNFRAGKGCVGKRERVKAFSDL